MTSSPLRAPFRTALREVAELVAVSTEIGWSDGTTSSAAVSPVEPVTGETPSSLMAAVTGPLAAAVSGVPLAEHEELLRRLHRGLAGNTTAKCAIDLAVHSALAMPFGGIAGYIGAKPRPLRTDVTISLDSPEAMAAEAAARVVDGFDVLKLKVGGEVAADIARVREVARTAGPGVTLRLDANQAWTAEEALAVLDGLERLGIRPELVEQPVAASDLVGMAAVVRHGLAPVLADESVHSASDVVRAAELGAADIVNVKLAKCGGLRAARDVVATAEACGLEVIVGCMLEPGPTVAAAAALAMTLPTSRGHDLDAGWWVAGPGPLLYRPPTVVLAGPGDEGAGR